VSCQFSKHNQPRVRKVVVLVLALLKVARHNLTFHLHVLPEVRMRVTIIRSSLILDFKTDTVQCAISSIKFPVTKHEIFSTNFYKEGSKSIEFPSHVEYDSAAHKIDFLLRNQALCMDTSHQILSKSRAVFSPKIAICILDLPIKLKINISCTLFSFLRKCRQR